MLLMIDKSYILLVFPNITLDFGLNAWSCLQYATDFVVNRKQIVLRVGQESNLHLAV
jgi:hypothetical protein